MVNKQGVILIFSLLVTVILSLLLVSFYFQSISENQLAKRYADSVRALWLAEAGIAKVKSNLGANPASGYIDNSRYTYNVPTPTRIDSTNYYTVQSTGTVTSASGVSVSRTISVTMKLNPPSASKFQYGLETTNHNLAYQDKNIINDEYPGQKAKKDSTQTFADLFGVSKSTMEAIAQDNGTHYTSGQFGSTINSSGITWINVTVPLFQIEHLNGSGVLVINGDFKLTGQGSFSGILYVIGSLTMRGNPEILGTVFVESAADVDIVDIQGSPGQIVYKSSKISDALVPLTSSKTIVSWKEI